MPITVEMPIRRVFHCRLKSSRLIIVPKWTMMKPTTTPASPSSDELANRSGGNRPVMKPTRKISDATKRLDSRDWVFLATQSLMVQTSMTTTKATTAFMA